MGKLQEVVLDKDIEELEAQIFGTTKEGEGDSVTDADETKPDEGTVKEAVVQSAESETAPTEKQEAQEGEDWEYRYKKHRAATDTWKYNARKQMAAKDARITSLEKIIRETPKPEVDIFKDTISEEDTQLLGEKAIDAMKRVSATAAENASAPIKAKLKEAERKNAAIEKADVDAKANTRSTNFIARLAKAVPNYQDVNFDPGFEKFLLDDDPINGGQRMKYFKYAEQHGDVATVANYMREFAPVKVDKLADKVTPTGKPVSNTDTAKLETQLLPVSDMEAFYTKVARGHYKGKASLEAKHQASWDLAVEEGRIDYRK